MNTDVIFVHVDSIRTNNNLESWHICLNGLVGAPHPNMFRIIANLKKEQSWIDNALRMLRAEQNAKKVPKREKLNAWRS